ncbi:MAG: helix-turn-helix domain-containing protein [Aquificae bacterium]|nr:helix-turn-helix domain-containing protein [Aquificota bacterium]
MADVGERAVNGERLYTIKEVSKIIRLSYRRTWELIAVERKIPAIRIAHMYLIPESALKEFINKSSTED